MRVCVGKSRRTRTRNLNSKVNGANAGLANPGDILYNNTPGVTTRLQREQIQQQQRLEQPQNLVMATNSVSASTSMSITSTTVTEVPSTENVNETNVESSTSFLNGTESISSATSPNVLVNCMSTRSPSDSHSIVKNTTTNENTSNGNDKEVSATALDVTSGNKLSDSPISSANNDTTAERNVQKYVYI